jgi:hypothetical protein
LKVNIAISGRCCAAAAALAIAAAAISPAELRAQLVVTDTVHTLPLMITDSALRKRFHDDSVRLGRGHFYRRFAAGFATSILLHESAHFAASYWMGFHPHLGIDKGRPTVFSGIDEGAHKREQFIFSAAGLTVQNLLDELVLDIPHHRGGAFERGILASGIGTTLFYVTIGRNAPVSDISVMARTSHLSKGQVSLIFGSVSAIDAFRMSRNRAYSHFFLAPVDRGRGLKGGVSITTR